MVTVSGEAAGVEVLGVMESSIRGVLQLLLSNNSVMDIAEDVWEPMDACLEKGRLFVDFKSTANKITEIESVDTPSAEV